MDNKMCVSCLTNVRKMFVLGCERCEGEALKYQQNFISALDYAIELINDTDRPQVTVFTENADEKAIEDMKAELQNVLDNDRPKGEWGKWVISEIRCPECLEYFDTDCYSTEELKKCPSCGADMRKGGEE